MADSKKLSIPSWQLAANRNTDNSEDNGKAPEGSSVSADRETLLEQASRFLQEESIRNAPIDKKVSFLESKGLENDEIQKLLGVSRNSETAQDQTQDQKQASATPESSQATSAASTEQPALPSPSASSPPTLQHAPVPNRDIPPIITYPEFLTQASKPPPLVNLQTLLYTLYGAAGLASTIYGASEFLVTPMIASLTSARHELAETAQRNLKVLNEKLENSVSTIPLAAAKLHKSDKSDAGEEDETASLTSDPSELYHRDIATQTSPELESSDYSSSLMTLESITESSTDDSSKALNTHVSRLKSIQSQLKDLVYAETQNDLACDNIKNRITNLQTYLDSLTYSSPAYLSSSLYGSYGDTSKDQKAGMSSGEADAIAAFRAEVRSAKGVLLSARNFPTGVRGGVRSSTRTTGAT